MCHIIYVLLTLYLYFSINVYTSILSYINMSILTQPLSPSFLHARQKLCIQQNTAKLPRSKDALHSRAAREIGRTFHQRRCKQHPILRMLHTFRLDKADGLCRREVGTARLPAVTLPCLDCLIIHIHSYLYCYPYYFISILLHYHIDVLTYCYIVSFLHYRISA